MEAFGTKKSQKKVTSLLTNMIGEDGITQRGDRGIRDGRLKDRAGVIEEVQEGVKREMMSLTDRRHILYAREKILPQDIINEIPYKLTHEALHKENEEGLRSLIINSLIREML